MKPNVGGIDRIFRIVLGIVILVAGWYYKSWWGLLGLIPLLTGLIRWCPLYYPFKASTAANKEPETPPAE